MKRIIIASVIALVATFATTAHNAPIAARWTMGANDTPQGWYTSTLTLKNIGNTALPADWTFFFNQFSRTVKLPADCPVDVEEISTTYYRVRPNAKYRPLQPGDSLVINLTMKGTLQCISYVPMGGHAVIGNNFDSPMPVNIQIDPLDANAPWKKRDGYPDGATVFSRNAAINPATAPAATGTWQGSPYDIFPTPKSVNINQNGEYVDVPSLVSIKTLALGTNRAKNFLRNRLQQRGVYTLAGQPFTIEMKIDKKLGLQKDEYYVLTVNRDGVVITAPTEDGLLNGAKTLIAAIDHTNGRRLPLAFITDYPDMNYRGFMMDIARNFFGLDNLKQLVDILAYYKINVMQLHFTDDEAWRIEIPGLPELTQIGSRRGCTVDETNFLAQIFDGNGNPNDLSQSANGYLTRDQFIDLLKYAHANGVKIIPEIETPGHARAAIVAMTTRYNDYNASGDTLEARRYQLVDPQDARDYASVQSYKGNVLNPALNGTYNFIDKVVAELAAMYKKAGLKLDVIHLGGDEVATAAWDGSPAVKRLMDTNHMADYRAVSDYYFGKVADLMHKRGIAVEGWQEIAMSPNVKYNQVLAPMTAGVTVWNTLGSRSTLPTQIAKADFPIILSCSHRYYVDMGYSWHQDEPGLRWSGPVDEFASWQPIVEINDPDVERHVIGIQAQLFGETLRSWPQVQAYILPKMFGIVERAWNKRGDTDDDARVRYNLKIGTRELPMLRGNGINFHIPQPGINVNGNRLVINTPYPAMSVHYTLDGSEPGTASPIYHGPVTLSGKTTTVKAKAFYLGKQSVTTTF